MTNFLVGLALAASSMGVAQRKPTEAMSSLLAAMALARSARSPSLAWTDSLGAILRSFAARSRPQAAESLNDWSPRPARSNSRPTFLPAGSPFSGDFGQLLDAVPDEPELVELELLSSPHAAATSETAATAAT